MFPEEKQCHIYYITRINPQCLISSHNIYKTRPMVIVYFLYRKNLFTKEKLNKKEQHKLYILLTIYRILFDTYKNMSM